MAKVTIKGYEEWANTEKQWEEYVINKVVSEVELTAVRVHRDSKLLTPVDTGKLRGSIELDIKKTKTSIESEIGTDVEYSEVVEFGGVNQKAQPYLIPSFDRNVKSLEININNILKGG